ncbi:hypothetical protein B0H11DRAFT_1743994, partial [Mycena galericulata]
HKDLGRSIKFFLWMLIHDGYKVGKHSEKIPGHEEKATCEKCGTCGVTETMEHILTECEENEQQIWDLASELCMKRTGSQLRPLIGEIMDCGSIKRGSKPGATDKGTSRLYRILVLESTHLIWRLRNEHRIQGKDPASVREMQLRWTRMINMRLDLDCQMTNKWRYEKKALVLKTWSKLIRNEDTLPADWTGEPQILVGVG